MASRFFMTRHNTPVARRLRRRSARELEAAAAAAPAPRVRVAPAGEALLMLARRGLHVRPTAHDLPFPADFAGDAAERLARRLGRYSFRLFLRGAIQHGASFRPAQATRYLDPTQAEAMAEALVELGLATRLPRGRYRLVQRARSFGGTLEWYVARELGARFGFEVATGLTFPVPGVGGDLDVVAGAEGKLVYLELKSSPPRHLLGPEVRAFFSRVRALRPDVTVFVVDTALRLSDKVVPMLRAELRRENAALPAPRAVVREVWALTPHLYAVNARHDLMANVGAAIGAGLRALAPPVP
jgi:hypothetical protein